MGKFLFSQRSLKNLEGVHSDLVRVMHLALDLSTIDFAVLEGLRTPERQHEVIDSGNSWTKNSRHLTGHAVDVGVVIDKHVIWTYAWYERLSKFVKEAANELKVPIEWGGDWKDKKDGGHYELTWAAYPLK